MEGHPEFRSEDKFRSKEAARHHAQNRVGEAVDLYGFAGNRRVRSEAALPTGVAEHDYGMGAHFFIVRRRQRPAENRVHAQHFEVIPCYLVAPDMRIRAVLADCDGRDSIADQSGERAAAVAEILVVWVGLIRGLGSIQENQLLRSLDRKGAQNQPIDGAERGGVCANAQCERQDRRGREAGALFQAAECEPEILQQVVHNVPLRNLAWRQ